MMYDVRMIKRARFYVDAMSQGKNPLTGEDVQPGDIITNERVKRCMEYIGIILDDVLKNGIGNEKTDFCISPAQKQNVVLSDVEIGVNDLAKRINNVLDTGFTKGITGNKIAEWLVKQGYLSEITSYEQKIKKTKVLNEHSKLIGISSRERVRNTGETYNQIMYSKKAQEFILRNIDDIAKS